MATRLRVSALEKRKLPVDIHGDVNFVGMGTYEMGQASSDAVRHRARETYGRSIATMTYATIGGEYRTPETFFDSGLYIALGGYRLQGCVAGTGLPSARVTVPAGRPAQRSLVDATEVSGLIDQENVTHVRISFAGSGP